MKPINSESGALGPRFRKSSCYRDAPSVADLLDGLSA